jgi:hypothetical protein
MLKKNIYLLYPPGSSGTYIHWCIHKSEKDLSNDTIDNPLNTKDNSTYGGVGTAHLHTRIPTHQSIHHHLCWMTYNQPKDKKVFLINCHNVPNSFQVSRPEMAISSIMASDPDPVIVVIHDNNDPDNKKYGALNNLTKWPIFFKANQAIEEKFNFDSFNCKDSIDARNLFVNRFAEIFPSLSGLDFDTLGKRLNWYKEWYEVRNQHNGHEVNEDTYVLPKLHIPNLYHICLTDIVNDKFLIWFNNFVNSIDAGNFDTSYVTKFHSTYVNAQPHLQWFEEIEKFRKTFQLTEYLESHSLLHAFVIMEVKPYLPDGYNWEKESIKDIVATAKLCKTTV